MTRFARAKGSKASNERVPEEATSWAEMKKQLLEKNKEVEDNKKRQEINNQRNANYKAFLEEKEDNERKEITWADFPGSSKPTKQNKTKLENKINTSLIHKNNRNIKIKFNEDSSDDEEFTLLKSKVDKVLDDMCTTGTYNKVPSGDKAVDDEITEPLSEKKKLKRKRTKGVVHENGTKRPEINSEKETTKNVDSDSDAPPDEETAKKEIVKPIIKVKKSKRKKIVIDKQEIPNIEQGISKPKKKRKASDSEVVVKKKFKKDEIKNNTEGKTKLGKENQKKKVLKENLTEKDIKKIEKKKQKRLKQVLKKKKHKAELKKQAEDKNNEKNNSDIVKTSQSSNKNHSDVSKTSFNHSDINKNNNVKIKPNNKSNNLNRKKVNVKNKDEQSRKKPLLPHKMFINGKELDIEYMDGFPIKKEDAERIKKLRKEMISKGLPRSEINIALKLERRKAEKAFAREKKKVCFNCRKSGHNLSECPELDKYQVAQTAGSGICFKCGSTEHTHFECKVVRGQEFKYAQCFICNEQGHIARQCPDNARGLYPKGGACKVCGDVTHLKKDCPTYQAQQQKQESKLKIETFGNSNPDVLEENNEDSSKKVVNKRPNKIIKF